jgi:hypothetical protein
VSLSGREKWLRAVRLGRHELQTRFGQALQKRIDVFSYRLRWQLGRVPLRATESAGQFFFSPLELTDRIHLLREHLPQQTATILGDADQICRHRFSLLGYSGLDYGAEIDWHLDAVHAKRAPLKPWFKIDFLNFSAVGDHKIIWELNRHQHLVTLSKAWLLTHRDHYVTELLSQWYAWQRANPYPLGINWTSSLEVAFRSLSWLWVHHLLADCPATSTQFREDLLHGLALHGRHIECYLSTYFSPNTHLLGEAVGLFFVGALCPEISAAPRWRMQGLEILVDQAASQVLDDGIYFEQSLYYHVYALDLFLHARWLAARNHIDVPASFDETLRKMLVVLEAICRNACPIGFGDDDGGRVFDPSRNRAEHMSDPLATGALLLPDEKLRAAARLTEEAIWLAGEQAVAELGSNHASSVPARSRSFPAGGVYVSSALCSNQQIIIDAGPQGAMRSGHGHADALSLQLCLGGRVWLIDPGTFCYMGPGEERNLFRGSRAHNTLCVDKLDQATSDGPFGWKNLPSVRVERWIAGESFALFAGSHTGYLRLSDPVLHQRVVVHLNRGLCLVLDIAEGTALHEVETSWHFAPDIKLTREGSSFIASHSDDPGTRMALVPIDSAEWQCQVTAGQVSPVYGLARAAPVLRCRATVPLPAEHAMIIRPVITETIDAGELLYATGDALRHSGGGVTAFEYRDGPWVHHFLFADSDIETWSFGDWMSDAYFLYCCRESQTISHLIACFVSSIEYKHEVLWSHAGSVERLEYWQADDKPEMSCSDPAAANGFRALLWNRVSPVL